MANFTIFLNDGTDWCVKYNGCLNEDSASEKIMSFWEFVNNNGIFITSINFIPAQAITRILLDD